MNLRFFGRSAVQAEVVNAWWTRNRPSAPRLFADELASALRLVAAGPGIGALYEPRGAQGVRRLLLPRTRYFVYYAYDRESAVVSAHLGELIPIP